MDQAAHNKIVSFIWGIADDVLRDLFVRGKYRDVILPMCVLRRLDAVLEPTKQAVLDTKKMLDDAGITEQQPALCAASQEAFYNTSPYTLRDLKSRTNPQQLQADFEAYLDGYSSNVQDILNNFEFRNVLARLSKANALGTLIEKFLDPDINVSPKPVMNGNGTVRHAALDNHAIGTVFEELVRKFNEENNEEAGEHWTPRDAVKLMARLIFDPIAKGVESGSYTLYDGAAGTGGMLTVAEDTLKGLTAARGKQVKTYLYGQEINPETYAICKADMLLKGEGQNADHIVGGAEHSTLSNDAYPTKEFDFLLSNPPYGKSWKKDLDQMGGKEEMRDPRFKVEHKGEELSLVTRSSDGQLLFLANMVHKMNRKSGLGSRIAEVHNGSSLFTGDAGQGESNIRRWIIENDWLEAIVALPLNMFYNTGIATYIWVLTNKKPEHRKGKVQLINATEWSNSLRKNLGKKNCELSPEDINRICDAFLKFEEAPESKVFPNEAFGYWKITVERPLRLSVDLSEAHRRAFRAACVEADEEPLANVVDRVMVKLGPGPHLNFNTFMDAVRADIDAHDMKLPAKRIKLLQTALADKDPSAAKVIKKKGKKGEPDQYEPDPDLRDTEQVPLLEPGSITAFFDREVKPHAPDAWVDEDNTLVGYEISFTRHFYQPPTLLPLNKIRDLIIAKEAQIEGIMARIIGAGHI
jgi:type I restriction enzyme M protein